MKKYIYGQRLLLDGHMQVLFQRSAGGQDVIVKAVATGNPLAVVITRLSDPFTKAEVDAEVTEVVEVAIEEGPIDELGLGVHVMVASPDFDEPWTGTISAIGEGDDEGKFLVTDDAEGEDDPHMVAAAHLSPTHAVNPASDGGGEA